METITTTHKSRNTKEYMRNYMREYYKKDPLKSRKYRLSCKTRKEYIIDDTILTKYKEDIHHIVKIKHLMNELNPNSLIHFLNEHASLNFDKRNDDEIDKNEYELNKIKTEQHVHKQDNDEQQNDHV